MNYFSEIRAFYDWLQFNSMPADAQALWHTLMYLNNKCAIKSGNEWLWRDEFTVTNITLLSILKFSRQQLDRMRNTLIQAGRIEYKKRNGNQSGLYKIIPFDANYVTQPVTQTVTQPVTQAGQNCSTLNNNNYNNNFNSTEKKENIKRKKYGEYQNVLLSDDDLAKLKAEYPSNWQNWIERLSGYMASTGKSYKNHLATIRNWAKKDSGGSKPNHGPSYDINEFEKLSMREDV